MSYICDKCGKDIVTGRSQQHKRGVAGKRWKKRAQKTARTFKPNLQKIAVMVSGVKQTMKLCAKCIKRFGKEGKLFDYKKVALG
jgi:large subunit ribosomal protein L28